MPPLGSLEVVVTGSSGVVGTAVGEALLEAGADVTGVDRGPNRWSARLDERTVEADLRDPGGVLPEAADAVVHLAARSRVMDSLEDPSEALENLESTFQVLEWARRHDVPRVLLASSREVYGSVAGGSAAEGDVDVADLENPYGASKVGSEALLQAWGNAFGLDAAAFRLSNVYGRYDLDRVVPLFVARAWEGRDLVVYGGEEKVLDLVHVDDVVDAFLQGLTDFPSVAGRAYNVASGEAAKLLDVAHVIADEAPGEVAVRTEPHREGEVARFVADVSRIREDLGWAPSTGLEEGIRDAVEWYGDRPKLRAEILG